jgi:hypothetical protein
MDHRTPTYNVKLDEFVSIGWVAPWKDQAETDAGLKPFNGSGLGATANRSTWISVPSDCGCQGRRSILNAISVQ